MFSLYTHWSGIGLDNVKRVYSRSHCSRIRILLFFSDFKKRDFLRFLNDLSISRKKSLAGL